jgi:16S rRNA G966 N2-methylase RsmD
MSKSPTRDEVALETINLKMTAALPDDYHCRCVYCVKGFKGVLIRKDGTSYRRTDRSRYYSAAERMKTGEEGKGGHLAKTPLHVARWAVQSFAKKGGWVLDPTMGAGTTAVESLNHGCNVFGVELDQKHMEAIEANMAENNPHKMKYHVEHGDARDLRAIMDRLIPDVGFDLVQNNPPYWGDQRAQTNAKLGEDPKNEKGQSAKMYTVGYDKSLPNLAFLKEGPEYWRTMHLIYSAAAERLKTGGRFVVGIKDQMRAKKADELHRKFAEMMETIPGLSFEGVVILPHWPKTLFMNTYRRFYPDAGPLPMHQSVIVFKKVAP